MKALCFVSALISSAAAVYAAELVVEKKPAAAITVSAKASEVEQFAASELNDYLQKITGTKLTIGEKCPANMVNVRYLLVKNSAGQVPDDVLKQAEKIQFDGFLVYSTKKDLVIVARRESGFLYGTYFLLTKYGECRWFTANPGDEYFEQKPDFVVPEQLTLRNPVFEKRTMMTNGVTPPEAFLWMVRNGYNFSHRPLTPTDNKNVSASYPIKRKLGQNIGALGTGFTWLLTGDNTQIRAKMFAEHPEYFGLRDGKRVLTGLDILRKKEPVSQPCTSNPEVIDIMVKTASDMFREAPESAYFDSVYGNDDHFFWCECEKCKALDDPQAGPNGKNSDRWWTFVNAFAAGVKRECPDKNITMEFFAYQDYRDVPRLVKPDPSVSVMICPHGRCYAHPLNDPSCPENGIYRKMCTDWRKIGMRSTVYEYHTVLPGKSVYIPLEHQWVEDLKFYHENNMRGYLLCWFFPTQPLGGNKQRHYIYKNMNQSLWQMGCLSGVFSWDINADYDKVWEDFNSKYYGDAWKYMKPYRLLLESAVKKSGVHMRYGSSSSATLGKCYDQPGVGKAAHEYLDKAMDAVKNDPMRLKRIQKEKEYFILNWEDSGYSAAGRDSSAAIAIPRNNDTITLDGKLDEPAWSKATVLKNFMVLGKDNVLANPQTTARLFCSNSDIYIGIEAEKSAAGEIDTAQANGIKQCGGSYLQFFIAPNALNGDYYHLSVTHNGFTGDALTQDNITRDESKPCGFEYKKTEDDKKWVLEVRIPAEKLGGVKDGSMALINIGRCTLEPDGKKQYSSNTTFTEGGFHNLKAYKLFRFGEAAPIVNASFEELMKPFTKQKTFWTFASGLQPKWWSFSRSQNNGGTLTMAKDSPAQGEYVIRVEKKNGTYPQFGQSLRGTLAKKYTFVISVRGNGVFEVRSDGMKHQRFDISSNQWKTVSGVFMPGRQKAFTIRLIDGMLDFDDVKIEAVSEEQLPDASKHW